LTCVGEVRQGTNDVLMPLGLSAVGSPLPYGGLDTSPTGINLQVQDGDNIQKWNGSQWVVHIRDLAEPTGWTPGGEPSLNVGEGFFYEGNLSAFNWTQILNP
jgi:hypothetical protein